MSVWFPVYPAYLKGNNMAELGIEAVRYPRTRLWSLDYTQVLWDSQTGTGTAEDWFKASEHDDVGISIDYNESWRTWWGGRMIRHNDGSVDTYPTNEFLKYITMPANPFADGPVGG